LEFRHNVNKVIQLLGCLAALISSLLATVLDSLSVQSSSLYATHENGTYRLYRNVGKSLPINAVEHS
jgi:hypothetical protein